MSELLALEFEPRKILGIDGQVTPSGVRIRSCFELAIPEELDLSHDPAAAGDWLKQQLAAKGVQCTQVVATFPREVAVVRHVEVPDVPDEELPDLVKFQAGLKSSLPLDQLCLDFLPLARSEEATSRDVLIASVSRQSLEELSAVTGAAGLNLVSAGLSPVSAAEVVLRTASADSTASGAASLIVTRHGPRIEISLLKDRQIVFSHFTQVAGEGEEADNQAVISAVARSLMGLTGPVQSKDIAHAWLVGSTAEFEALAPLLASRLNPEVHVVDPFAVAGLQMAAEVPAVASAYSALVGSLLAKSQPLAEPIDFLDPRKPPVKPDHTRRRAIWGAAIAAGIALIVGGSIYSKVGQLNKQIETLKTENAELDRDIKRDRPLLEKAALVEEWTADRTLWLDELVALQTLLPPADRAYYQELRLNLGAADAKGRIRLTGFYRDRADGIDFGKRVLRHDERYQFLGDTSRNDERAPHHPWTFDTELLLQQDAPQVELTSSSAGTEKDAKPAQDGSAKSADETKAKEEAGDRPS